MLTSAAVMLPWQLHNWTAPTRNNKWDAFVTSINAHFVAAPERLLFYLNDSGSDSGQAWRAMAIMITLCGSVATSPQRDSECEVDAAGGVLYHSTELCVDSMRCVYISHRLQAVLCCLPAHIQ